MQVRKAGWRSAGKRGPDGGAVWAKGWRAWALMWDIAGLGSCTQSRSAALVSAYGEERAERRGWWRQSGGARCALLWLCARVH